MGPFSCWGAYEPAWIWLALAHCYWASSRGSVLGDVHTYLFCDKWGDIPQHSCTGRMCAQLPSESGRNCGHFERVHWSQWDYAAPRAVLLAFAQGLMAFSHLEFAMSWPGSMYIGSLLVGFGYGCHWSVFPATASELFGLKNFGTLYNVLTIAVPTGSLIFSGLIAGTLYDKEAAKQKNGSVGAQVIMASNDEGLVCNGPVCFQVTFIIMTVICVVGVVNLVLTKRTYRVYQTLYGKNMGPLSNVPSRKPSFARQPSLGPVMEEQEEEASSSH